MSLSSRAISVLVRSSSCVVLPLLVLLGGGRRAVVAVYVGGVHQQWWTCTTCTQARVLVNKYMLNTKQLHHRATVRPPPHYAHDDNCFPSNSAATQRHSTFTKRAHSPALCPTLSLGSGVVCGCGRCGALGGGWCSHLVCCCAHDDGKHNCVYTIANHCSYRMYLLVVPRWPVRPRAAAVLFLVGLLAHP